jgi:hypothetical protein
MKLWKNVQPTFTALRTTLDSVTLDAPWQLATQAELDQYLDDNRPTPRGVPPFADAAALRIALVTEGWVTVGSPTTAIADLNAWAAAHIAALGTAVQRTKAHIKWQFAGSFAFDDPLIVHFATRDSKTVAQRGALFIAAEDVS